MEENKKIGILALSRLTISDGSLEVLKWIALISMTIDHANRFFFQARLYNAYCIGRLAMPLFAFIFAYNLSRPNTLINGAYFKTFKRLTFFGLLATPGYISMRALEHLWPFNIMFMLLAAAACFYFIEKGGFNLILAVFIFLIAGLFVEYSWQGLILCLTGWFYCKKPSLLTLLFYGYAYLLIDGQNGNHWALLALSLIFLSTRINLNVRRIPYFFYIYYPLHLTFFYLIKQLI